MINSKSWAADAKASAALNAVRPYSGATRTIPFRRVSDGSYATIHTGRPARKIGFSQPKVVPEKILQAFNTWAFKREQPENTPLMLQLIGEAIWLGQPIPFVLYWGKGPRQHLDEPDKICLDYLATFTRRVNEAYPPGASLKLIFTDTHAKLNGHTSQNIQSYCDAIDAEARRRGFATCWLSDLVCAARAAGALDLPDEPMPEETLRKLTASAAKWYHGEGTIEEGAARYYRLNMIEKRAVQLAFPSSIFITFNGSEFRYLFPDDLPIFYMYSLRRGMSVKPWFLPDAAHPARQAQPAHAE